MLKKLIRTIHSAIWWTNWVGLMVLSLIVDAVFFPGNKKMHRKIERFWAWTLMKIGFVDLQIKGQENIPHGETVVYMANHQSHLDWPIILRSIPEQYLFLAKHELFQVPIFGDYMRLQEYIPIDRNNIRSSLRSYKKVKDRIREGHSIVIYPEGTRSYTETLQEFKSFSFSFLKEVKVRVVPIAISGSMNVQKRGNKSINPGTVKVTILPPVSFDDLYQLDKKAFSAASSNRVRESLLEVLGGSEVIVTNEG